MAAETEFRTVLSKRRKRIDNDQCGSYSSSLESKIDRIFGELKMIREGQEQTNRGMQAFQNNFLCMGNKMAEMIDVTNRNTSMLKTLAYKSIDLEARSRRNNLIFWGHVEQSYENCFGIIRKHIFEDHSDRMYMSRAHRLGPRKIGQRVSSRPII